MTTSVTNFFKNLPDFQVEPENHAKRKEMGLNAGKKLEKSVETFDFSQLAGKKYHIPIPAYIPYAGDPRWKDAPFGPVNTLEKAGCIVFVIKSLLDYYGYKNVSIEEITKACVSKGYRMWKFPTVSESLNLEEITLEKVKEAFPGNPYVQACKDLKELGTPVGVGGSFYFLDSIINMLSGNTSDRYHTRLSCVEDILHNIAMGHPVPLRVENSIYLDDPSKKEGHYVVLFAVVHGVATVIDSNSRTPVKVLFEQVMRAATANPRLIAAWDTSKIKFACQSSKKEGH